MYLHLIAAAKEAEYHIKNNLVDNIKETLIKQSINLAIGCISDIIIEYQVLTLLQSYVQNVIVNIE